ncbi:hypothetical protein NIES2119_06680 [[Phormidium ambiguum] IAM M-71]|uniref:NACHT domain-containing protein n=1 Tax=[Phormidium ambiguum] IAM M-71 TaxID=454136 RepID=A0A1U7IPY6_9CYAN|nr:HEAT repeat domain-containing protein [Phormidium ambiguum]OKH39418.1 hypothetical protein NIES2119_06680 [Phormidium ambiguum IAM M-71]
MAAQEDLPEEKRRFLEELATQYEFFGDTREAFLNRFDESKAGQDNTTLANSINWTRQPADKAQKLQDELKNIYKVLEKDGCLILRESSNEKKQGRSPKGKSPWEQAFKWLWETKFPNWQKKPSSDNIDWREICTKVLETQHLRRQATTQQYELNIYVPLGLMERPKTPNPRINPTGEDSPPQKEPELQIVEKYKDDAFFQKVIAENHTEKGKHIAIIGEPGAGKTTLLGELAQQLHEKSSDFPICIRLADLRDREIKDYLLNNWLEKALEYIHPVPQNITPEITEALKQLFRQGKVWLLLDGVDEMTATSPIEALTRIREQLTDWVGKARVVLTCRLNVWDAAISNPLTDFDIYKNLPLEPDDVDKFICQWFEQASHDAGNETFWREQGKRLTRQLKEPGKDNIRKMVCNPLRLSMLCQSWCVPEQELPETKAALYEQFTTYFFEWKQEEFAKKQRVLNQRDKQQIQQALAKLALAAMESVNRFRIEQEFAIEQMEEVWFNLADELGWLVLVDRDTRTRKPVYAFFHPTFQEYFTACAIEDWHFFLNHQIPPVSSCSYRIFERQWREVILLWLGRREIEGKQKEEFIDALVDFKDGCGKWQNLYVNSNFSKSIYCVDKGFYEYRAYFLAAAAIAEFKDYYQIDEVLEQIVRWGFGYFDSEKQEWVKFSYAISDAAREALPQTQHPKAINTLVQLFKSDQLDDFTRSRVAESLGKIGQDNQNAIDALVQLLSSTHLDDSIRRLVAESLGKIGQGNQNAIDALVQLLSCPQLKDDTHLQVAYCLGNIGKGNQKAINTLVQLLNSSDLDDYYRWKVAEILGKIDPGNQKAIDALVQLLSSPLLRDFTRRRVAVSLGIDPGNQKAIDTLVQLLNSSNLDDYYRWEVAESLGKIDPGNQKVIDTLEQLLSSPLLRDFTRRQVAESLGKIDPDPGNQKAIDALVQLLSSPQLEDSACRLVAFSLGDIGQGNQKAIDTLVQLLSSDQLDDFTRRQVAESLGKIGQGNQKAIDTLVQLLSSDQLDDFIRRRVAESLGKIGQGNQKAIDTLVQLLSSDQLDDFTRRQVAESLGKIGQGNQKAIDALVQLLNSSDLDDYFRWKVTESLGKIGQGSQNAIDTLVQLLNSSDLDYYFRWKVAKSLGEIEPGNQNAIDALVQLLKCDQLNDNTRMEVAKSLSNIDPGNQNAIDVLVQLLNSPQLDDDTRRGVAERLKKIQTDKQFSVIKILKSNFNNSQQIDYAYYELIWHYAQNLPYPDFYQAWHQDTLTNTATANLNIANLPQVLAEAINNQPELCSKVKLICIDIDQIIDPENPAPEIYDLMLNQNCPEWQNGYPETMQKLKLYWNYLRRNSEIPLFFICYDSTALTATPTGFSDTFLTALSKFDGAICVVTSPPNPLSATERGSKNNSPSSVAGEGVRGWGFLQTFSPSQADLISNIIKWIETKILET